MHVRLLGGFGIDVDGVAIDARRWRLRKARALVAMLALAPEQRIHREQVLEQLWPERDPGSAAQNLHQTLYIARRALADADAEDLLAIRADMVVLCDARPIEVDALEFEHAAAVALAGSDESALRAALFLYNGDLAPELAYQDCLSGRREELRETYRAVLMRLATTLLGEGRAPESQLLLHRVLQSDALHEGAVRVLMQVLASSGRRSEALDRYERLRDDLLEAFGTDPDPQTRQQYQELLTGAATPIEQPQRRRGRLPTPLTSFIGRDRELADVERLFRRTRLLTLTGPGGCGKTRLALEAGQHVGTDSDGVWFVDLSALGEARLVPDVTAVALDLEAGSGSDSTRTLIDQLEHLAPLVIFDNCEHLLDACAHLVTALLAGCPGIRILTTSRERLRVPGEVTLRVPSLDLPDEVTNGVELSRLARIGSVRLFVERASEVRVGFALDADNSAAVVGLCRRLDGMPLALELAAARVAMMQPSEILDRLGDALAVLGHGPSAITRHQTLRAALQWSHHLLVPAEQILLRRLSVFAGSFDLAAVEEVCVTAPLDRREALDLLGRLVDKSLVLAERSISGSRYRLLETIRQFSHEQLELARESRRVAEAHCAHYLDLSSAHDPERARGVVTEHPRLLDLEHDNLRAALRWACVHDPASAIGLAAGLWRFWFLRGHAVEGAGWVERALEAAPDPAPDRARALFGLTGLDSRRGRSSRHRALGAEAVAVLERVAGPGEVALGRLVQGVLMWSTFDLDAAGGVATEVQRVAGEHGRADLVAASAWLHGMIALQREEPVAAEARFRACLAALEQVDPETAPFLPVITPCLILVPVAGRTLPCFEETLLLARRVGAAQAVAYVLSAIGYAQRLSADLTAAGDVITAAADRFADIGDDLGRAQALNQLGCVRRDAGDFDAAAGHLHEARSLRQRLGDRRGELLTTMNEALLLSARGDCERALRGARGCLAASGALHDRPAVGGALAALGNIELKAGEVRAARALYERAAEEFAPQGWVRIEAWHRLVAAELATELDEIERAVQHLDRAAAVFDGSGSRVATRRVDALRRGLMSRR